MATLKRVVGVFENGSRHWVGDGFHVRNLFPSNGIENEIDPFLMLDYAGPTVVPPGQRPRGVDEHPHRGFETVTIAYQGAVEHRDSGGHTGTIHPGDVQWMTAASGVVHEEKHEREFAKEGGIFEMVQLWVNLPREHKMSAPRYQTLLNSQIPVVQLGAAGYARVIAGELDGAKGPAKTFTPVNVFDVRLKAGGKTNLSLLAGHNAAVVLLKGGVVLNSSTPLEGEALIALLSNSGDGVEIEAKEDTTLLVLSGQPIHEPVASYGPFVMNTQEELMRAVEDYRAGKMGHLVAR
ncbi:MAG TPA: pirin family protein [Candidatus Aquilonibacter sp.]|nr:pirin family protein [Candidatus Aquilonibacter sp.]